MLLARVRRPVPLYWTTFLVVGFALSVLGPALTSLRDRTGADLGDIGILFVGQSAGYVVGSLAGGRLYDRYRGHHVFGWALATVAAGLVLVPLASSLPSLFGAFALVGLGASTCDVGANALLMWELGPSGGRSMNVLHLCFGVGALAAPPFVYLGLDAAVVVAAGVCLALAAAGLTITPPVVRPVEQHQSGGQSRPLLTLLATFFFLYVGLEVGFAGWIHTYAGEIEFSERAATWLTTTFWIGFTTGRIVASAIAPHVRPRHLLLVACVASVVVPVALVVADGRATAVWIGTAVFGLATAPQFPAMLSYLERRIHVTGTATSWFVGAAGFGGLLFPYLIGWWFAATGAGALPWAMVVLGTLTLMSFAASDRVLGDGRHGAGPLPPV